MRGKYIRTKEIREKISKNRTGKCLGHASYHIKHTPEAIKKIGESSKKHWQNIEYRKFQTERMLGENNPSKRPEVIFKLSGVNNHRWIFDRSLLKQEDRRNDPAYKEWRKNVWLRDNFRCKISNEDCKGRIEAHHILGWKEFPELRYVVNNGITLCHFHHPRKKNDESRLSPYFQELVENQKK